MMNLKTTSCFLLAVATTTTSGWAMNMESATSAASSMGSLEASSSGAFKSGFGVGASVGYGFSKADIKTTLVAPGLPNGIQKVKINQGPLTGTLFVDYQNISSSGWLVGGALALDVDAQVLKKTGPVSGWNNVGASISSTVKRTFAVAPMLMMGKKFSEKWLGSLQVGPSFACFSHSSTLTTPFATVKDSDKNNQVGFTVGIKLSYSLSPKIVSFLGVDYTHYGKIKNKYNQTFLINPAGLPVNGQSHKAKVIYSVLTPKVGVAYRF